MRDDPVEWARLCREQAGLTPDPKIAGLLMQLAEQCEALAERIRDPDEGPFDDSWPKGDQPAD